MLKEQRLIYRLSLGQPNQEDLVDILTRGGPELRAILSPLALDLSAFSRFAGEDASYSLPPVLPCR